MSSNFTSNCTSHFTIFTLYSLFQGLEVQFYLETHLTSRDQAESVAVID